MHTIVLNMTPGVFHPRANKAVLFIGDGISKQNHDAMLCQMMRTESISGISTGELNPNLLVVQNQVMSNFTLQVSNLNHLIDFIDVY